MAKKLITFRIEDKTLERMEKIAELKRRKTTELIRMVIEDYTMQFEDLSTMQKHTTGNKAIF